MAGLGLAGGYGAGAASEALRKLQEFRLREQALADSQKQAELRASIGLREIADREADTDLRRKALEFQMTPVEAPEEFSALTGATDAEGNSVMVSKRGTYKPLPGVKPIKPTVAEKAPTLTWVTNPDGSQTRVADAPGLRSSRMPQQPSSASAPKPKDPDQDLTPLAMQAAENPGILDGMTPTARTAVLAIIANNGQVRTVAQNNARTQLQEAKDSLSQIRQSGGLAGAVGAKGASSLFGYLDTPIAGTNAAGFTAKLQQLQARLTMPKLQFMRGLGAMSEKEFAALSRAATALDTNMSEVDFLKELDLIDASLSGALARLPWSAPSSGVTQRSSPAQGPVVGTLGTVNGIPAVWDGSAWVQR